MRRALLLALLAAGCADRIDGKTAEEWTAELADEAKGPEALKALEAHGAEATGVLTAIVRAGTARPQVMAASALAKIGPAAAPAVPALVEALRSKDRRVRGMSAIALGRIGPDARDGLVALDGALKDRDIRVRVAAALAIHGITGDTAAPTRVLFSAFTSKDPEVRAMVAEAFQELGTPVTPMLIQSLKNPDETTRLNAAKTIGAMGPLAAEAKEALLIALEDNSEAVRAAVAEALTEIEPR